MASRKYQPLQEIELDVLFRGDLSKLPGTYYVGLGTGPLPENTDSVLSDIVEVAGSGYARVALARNTTDFPFKVIADSLWKVVSLTKRWAATGLWTPADFMFLCDAAAGTTGNLYAACTLDEPFLLRTGETWDGIFEYVGTA